MKKPSWAAPAGALCVALFTSNAHGQRPPLEFKGLAPGKEVGEIVSNPGWKCRPETLAGADTVCTKANDTIAGVPAGLVLVGTKDGKALTILVSFAQNHFSTVAEAMQLKYGTADKANKETKTTRAGVEFASQVLEWDDQEKHMRLEERTSRIDRSALYISSTDAARASMQQRKERAEKNKSDL